jgi:hypothetical protein
MTLTAYNTRKTSTIASHVRMKTSEASSHRSCRGNACHTRPMCIGDSSGTIGMRTRDATASVSMASAIDARRPSCTPPRRPKYAMASPPMAGARTIGTRRRKDCTVKPMVRFSLGRASPTTAKRVGLAMASHAITRARAANARGHAGIRAKRA